MKKDDFFDEKTVQLYHFIKSQFNKNAMTIANFILKSFLNNDNLIMYNSTE